MSKEKIDEMAKDLCDSTMCDLETFNDCRMPQGNCSRCQRVAKDLYNAGYRKQSENVTDINVGSKSEWISVEERLPDIDELCLLSMENRITKYRWVVIGYFHTNYDEYVTHWMPLPEAPKMRKEDEGK